MRRIDGRLKKALVTIRALENQLKASANQSQVRKQLGETIDQLFYEIGMDWLDLRLQMSQPAGTAERLQQKLPRGFENSSILPRNGKACPQQAERCVLSISRTRPATGPSRASGARSCPHHALPEKQREGLRPDGLEWLYTF